MIIRLYDFYFTDTRVDISRNVLFLFWMHFLVFGRFKYVLISNTGLCYENHVRQDYTKGENK